MWSWFACGRHVPGAVDVCILRDGAHGAGVYVRVFKLSMPTTTTFLSKKVLVWRVRCIPCALFFEEGSPQPLAVAIRMAFVSYDTTDETSHYAFLSRC